MTAKKTKRKAKGTDLTVVYRKVTDLRAHARNSRTHTDAQVDKIAASIKEFGWTNPLLIDPDDIIIAGHGRLAAAVQLGMSEVPCIVLTGLTEPQRRAYLIADNALPLEAGWDEDMLKLELAELMSTGYDTSLTGLAASMLTALTPSTDTDEQPAEPQGMTPDDYGAATALQRGSGPLHYWHKQGYLDTERVLDFGSGRDEHQFAKYDAFAHPEPGPLLESWDVVMLNYVLNVQPSDHLIDLIAALISRLLVPGGLALVAVVTDKASSGKPACAGRDAKSPAEWERMLGKFFAVRRAEGAKFTGFVCVARGAAG